MASSPTELRAEHFTSFDGVRLAWHELGQGRPVVLFHGLFSNAKTNWVRYGHAALIAARGFRVIMPDLRGHGESGAPHEAQAYPPDVLARDGECLVEHLGLTEFDLGGYSLGGRTTVRMLARGVKPRRAALSGMGLEGILHTAGRGEFFRKVLQGIGSHERMSPEWMAEAFLKTTGGDPDALAHVLDTFVDTPREVLAKIATPVLVATGAEDDDNGSGRALAEALPDARFVEIPGNHMSAVTKPELGQAIADFLAK